MHLVRGPAEVANPHRPGAGALLDIYEPAENVEVSSAREYAAILTLVITHATSQTADKSIDKTRDAYLQPLQRKGPHAPQSTTGTAASPSGLPAIGVTACAWVCVSRVRSNH